MQFIKKNLKIILVVVGIIIIIIYSYVTSLNVDKIDKKAGYFIKQDEITGETPLYIIETFPKDGSDSYGNYLNILFSKPIINEEFTVITKPKMEVETSVLPQDPNRLFISPKELWKKELYTISVQSKTMQGGFEFKVNFIEEPIPEYILDESNLYNN